VTDEERDEQFHRDSKSVAFARLDDRQLCPLEPLGESRVVKRGDMVFKAAQCDMGLTVVVDGEIHENVPRVFPKDHSNRF
jgi:hypothetical protein